MRKLILGISLFVFFASCKEENKESDKQMAAEEMPAVIEDDWEILFDGSSFDEWKEFKSDSVSNVWTIEGDAMVYSPPMEGEENKNHDLVTRKEYTDFVLSLD
ncbi:MAG: family 16 glycoside hydrolase, partial [Maribacter sp.]